MFRSFVLAAFLSVSQHKPDRIRKHVLKAVKELLKQHAAREELTRLTRFSLSSNSALKRTTVFNRTAPRS